MLTQVKVGAAVSAIMRGTSGSDAPMNGTGGVVVRTVVPASRDDGAGAAERLPAESRNSTVPARGVEETLLGTVSEAPHLAAWRTAR